MYKRQTLTLLFVVFWFVVWPAGWEAITRGRTLGKLALGLRTVRDDGGPIVTRHAVTRALVGWVELWLTFGMVAIVAALLNRRGKRLGDLAAGTYVIHDRVSLRMAKPVPMPPELAAWARDADVAELPPGLAVALRQFLGRAAGMSPAAREVLGPTSSTGCCRTCRRTRPPGHPGRPSSPPSSPSGGPATPAGCGGRRRCASGSCRPTRSPEPSPPATQARSAA